MPRRDDKYMLLQRDKIVVAGLKEFAAHGFQRASMRNVAKRLGISVGTLYIHFRNKDELFQGVLDRHRSEFPGVLTASLSELRGYIRQRWSQPLDADYRRMACMSAHMISESLGNQKVMRRLEILTESSVKLFETAVARDSQLARLSSAKRRALARRLLYWWTGVGFYRSDKLGSNSRKLLPDLELGFDLLIAAALRE
jgi:AcrR family transcriptional regulator